MAGDVLLATVATVGATVTAPAGWTVVGSTSNTGVRTTMWWRVATGADPSSWTFVLSGSQKAAGRMVAYSGVHQTSPVDVTATAVTVSGTSHPAPLLTTTEANRLILTVASVAVRTSFTPAVSTTERVDVSANNGAPTVTVELAEHAQPVEGLSTLRTPVSALAGLGATMTVALRPANSGTTKTLRYSYSGGADATALTLTNANTVVDRTISLPGGVVVTRQTATVFTWAYPNIHGDITYTIDHTGTRAGPFLYDPYGQPLTGVANTSPGDLDGGWLGQHQRPTEHQPELKPTIEMGARPYRPDLGRFLRIDPIDGGATHSNYAYVNDPINAFDLDGKACRWAGGLQDGVIVGKGTLHGNCPFNKKMSDLARATAHAQGRWAEGYGTNKSKCPSWLRSTASFFSWSGLYKDVRKMVVQPTKKNGAWLVVDGWYWTITKTSAQGGLAGAKIAKSLSIVSGVAEIVGVFCSGT